MASGLLKKNCKQIFFFFFLNFAVLLSMETVNCCVCIFHLHSLGILQEFVFFFFCAFNCFFCLLFSNCQTCNAFLCCRFTNASRLQFRVSFSFFSGGVFMQWVSILCDLLPCFCIHVTFFYYMPLSSHCWFGLLCYFCCI